MVDDKYTDLIAKYLSGNIASQDKGDLMRWIKRDPANQVFFDSMLEVWNEAGDYDDEIVVDTDQAWSRFEQTFEANETKIFEPREKEASVVNISGRKKWLRVAAAVLLLASVGYWWSNSGLGIGEPQIVQFQTGPQERTEHILPDGSTVWLNQNTVISYEEDFEPRTLELEGEAFFDVLRNPDQPFSILSGGTETKVLGTSFNVRAYPGEEKVEVTVETGKVEVKRKTEEEKASGQILLVAGKSGSYDKRTEELIINEEAIVNAPAWKNRVLNFDETKLRDVLTALERYFDTEIKVENISLLDCRWNGNYPEPELEVFMESFKFQFEVEIEKKDGRYILREGNCKG